MADKRQDHEPAELAEQELDGAVGGRKAGSGQHERPRPSDPCTGGE